MEKKKKAKVMERYKDLISPHYWTIESVGKAKQLPSTTETSFIKILHVYVWCQT